MQLIISHPAVKVNSTCRNYWDHQVDFITKGQLLIIYSAFVKYLKMNGNTMKECISYI